VSLKLYTDDGREHGKRERVKELDCVVEGPHVRVCGILIMAKGGPGGLAVDKLLCHEHVLLMLRRSWTWTWTWT
jgi:hypothetical protein